MQLGYDLRTRTISTLRQDRVRLYLQALHDNAKIVDHREDILRESEQARAAADAQTAGR